MHKKRKENKFLIQDITDLNNSFNELMKKNEYEKARQISTEICRIIESDSSKDSMEYAISIFNLGLCEMFDKKESKAKELFVSSSEIIRNKKGIENMDYVQVLCAQIRLSSNTNDTDNLENLVLELKSILLKAFDENNHEHAITLKQISKLLIELGDFRYAQEILKKSLQFFQTHPSSLMELSSTNSELGVISQQLGNYEDARNYYSETLEIHQEQYGEKHLTCQNDLSLLAKINYHIGRYEEAAALYDKLLTIQENTIGKNNIEYATTVNNKAEIFHHSGNYSEAKKIHEEACHLWSKLPSKIHPKYALGLNNKSMLYQHMGQYDQAKKFLTEALYIMKETQNEKSHDYSIMLHNLGALFQLLGNESNAKENMLKSLKLKENLFGKEHPEYAAALNSLGSFYIEYDFKESEKFLSESIKIYEKKNLRHHPSYGVALNNLGSLYNRYGFFQEAAGILERALSVKSLISGEHSVEFAHALDDLANTFVHLNQYTRSEQIFKRAEDVYKEKIPESHPTFLAHFNTCF